MMLKKSIALLLAIVMSVVLCGCGETNDTNGSSSVEDETSSVVTQSPSSETPSSNEEKPVSSEPQPVGYDFSKPVPETERGEESYLDKAVFIGDSVTNGTTIYKYFGNSTVLAYDGVNPSTAAGDSAYKTENGNKISFTEAVKDIDADKIFIMFGTNGLAWLSVDSMVSNIETLAVDLKNAKPDAKIIVQSIAPVTAEKHAKDSRYDNDKVRRYNNGLLEMCSKNQIYFLDTYQAFADSQGNMDNDLSTDGVHFGRTLYQAWGDYVFSHVIE